MARLNSEGMEIETEMGMAKHSYSLMEHMETIEAEGRQVYYSINHTFDYVKKKRRTDLAENVKVELPKPISAKRDIKLLVPQK